jgi:carbon-monoxide dehydrogenase small subunit
MAERLCDRPAPRASEAPLAGARPGCVDTRTLDGLNQRVRRRLTGHPTESLVSDSTTVCTLRVNGDVRTCAVTPATTLLEALRVGLGLTGSKQGCDKGDCGACTVALDGEPALACITLALACEGRAITTVEGLARDGRLHPLQDAFDATGGAQCGFCTPGVLISAWALLRRTTHPSRREIAEALSGNLCRCTGYTKILDAVELAASRMRGEGA